MSPFTTKTRTDWYSLFETAFDYFNLCFTELYFINTYLLCLTVFYLILPSSRCALSSYVRLLNEYDCAVLCCIEANSRWKSRWYCTYWNLGLLHEGEAGRYSGLVSCKPVWFESAWVCVGIDLYTVFQQNSAKCQKFVTFPPSLIVFGDVLTKTILHSLWDTV